MTRVFQYKMSWPCMQDASQLRNLSLSLPTDVSVRGSAAHASAFFGSLELLAYLLVR